MRILLIDMKGWDGAEPERESRVAYLRDAMSDVLGNGTVSPWQFVHGPAGFVPDWQASVMEKCATFNAVVLHCSDQQTDVESLLPLIQGKPVLGYSYGNPLEATSQFFNQNRNRAAYIPCVYKFPTERIIRWVLAIRDANGDPDAIRCACHVASGFRDDLESHLLELKKGWVAGDSLDELRTKRNSCKELGEPC